VLRAIEETPGLRARDLAREIGLEAYTVRKRTAELRRAGLARNQSKTLDPGEELRWFPARERGKTHA
jgi:DNA-binding IclR family transcriptional regulator